MPADARTLLKPSNNYQIEKLGQNGEYFYFGVVKNIDSILQSNQFSGIKSIKMQFNIDGLALFKSSNVQLWPILGMVRH